MRVLVAEPARIGDHDSILQCPRRTRDDEAGVDGGRLR